MRWAIWFDFRFLSTGQASPNDTGIVIIIIVGGAERIFHDGGIIAQTRFREVPGRKMLVGEGQAQGP